MPENFGLTAGAPASSVHMPDIPGRSLAKGQYSPLITKNEPRIVPASLDF